MLRLRCVNAMLDSMASAAIDLEELFKQAWFSYVFVTCTWNILECGTVTYDWP